MAYMSFQAQLLSIMDIVAKAAVTEIERRVAESCAVMRLELSRSRKDIDALKRKCVMMDSELRRVRGRGRRRVWMCGTSDRGLTPLKTLRDADAGVNRDQELNPDTQSVCSVEEDFCAPSVKQERQEQETGGTEHQIEAPENQKAVFGVSETHNAPLTHAQTSTDPPQRDQERLEHHIKAEDDDVGAKVHLSFIQSWSNVPPSAENRPDERNLSQNTAELPRNSLSNVETGHQVVGVYVDPSAAPERRLRAQCVWSVEAEKRFVCSFCQKSFSRFSQLKEHQRSHTGERPFSCAQCGRSFTKHCNLIRHAVVHSGEKPHQCSVCGRRFTQRSSLTSHQRMHTHTQGHTHGWQHR